MDEAPSGREGGSREEDRESWRRGRVYVPLRCERPPLRRGSRCQEAGCGSREGPPLRVPCCEKHSVASLQLRGIALCLGLPAPARHFLGSPRPCRVWPGYQGSHLRLSLHWSSHEPAKAPSKLCCGQAPPPSPRCTGVRPAWQSEGCSCSLVHRCYSR